MMSSRLSLVISTGSRLLSSVRCSRSIAVQCKLEEFQLTKYINLRTFTTIRAERHLREWKNGLSCLSCNYYSQQADKKKSDESDFVKKYEEKWPEPKLTIYQRLKVMFKDYWYVTMPVHVVTSIFWFAGFYYLAISGVDIAAFLEAISAPESWVTTMRSSKASHFVAAYALYKIASPARYTVTLGGTTISINYLTKWGWIKPMPNREQIKRMYQERKGAFKDLKTSYKDKMQVTKDELLKAKQDMKKQFDKAKGDLQRSVVETKEEFKDNMNTADKELKHIGRLLVKSSKNYVQSELRKKTKE